MRHFVRLGKATLAQKSTVSALPSFWSLVWLICLCCFVWGARNIDHVRSDMDDDENIMERTAQSAREGVRHGRSKEGVILLSGVCILTASLCAKTSFNPVVDWCKREVSGQPPALLPGCRFFHGKLDLSRRGVSKCNVFIPGLVFRIGSYALVRLVLILQLLTPSSISFLVTPSLTNHMVTPRTSTFLFRLSSSKNNI